MAGRVAAGATQALGVKPLLRPFMMADRWRPRALVAVACLLLAGAFALGQWLGGGGAGSGELQARIAALRRENRALSERVVQLETDDKVKREAYRQVEQQLAELQGVVIEQQEDLAFYRSLVAGPGRGPLRIRRAMVLPGLRPATYRLRLLISQGEKAEREIRGEVFVRLEGTRGNKAVTLDLSQLGSPGRSPERLRFAFRYFQDLEAEFALPTDFTPARLVVRVAPSTRGTAPTVESFPWTVATG